LLESYEDEIKGAKFSEERLKRQRKVYKDEMKKH